MSFFKQLGLWIAKRADVPDAKSVEEAKSALRHVLHLMEDPTIFMEIMAMEEAEDSEMVDLARMLTLLNHEDEFYQEQGAALLMSYNSEEAWHAMMTGVSFEDGIQHSSLKISPVLKKVLLQNPHYDYSHIQTLISRIHWKV